MPKYLMSASYTAQGAQGLLKEGGSKRKAAAEAVARSVGGSIDAFYFAFGKQDVFILADLPDNSAAAALSLAVSSSGAVSIRTTTLLTPEELDAASTRRPAYQPPKP